MSNKTAVQQPLYLRLGAILLACVAVAFVLLFLVLAAFRANYPFELEWTEGVSVDEIRWILSGKPLYGGPSLSFLPLAYNPLYFYISAVLVRLMGVGLLAPRLLSILATIGSCLFLYAIVREDGNPVPGIIAAGLYAAAFRFAGSWMDLAKTDSLFLFFILGGFYVGQKWPGRWGQVFSGLIFVASYYTKQSALPVLLFFGVASLIINRGRNWLQWLTVTMVGGGIFFLWDVLSSGWYTFYAVEILSYHHLVTLYLSFWESLGRNWGAALVVGLFIWLPFWPKWKNRQINWSAVSLAVALVFTSWIASLKVWTYDNAFMPACAGLAILAGLGYRQAVHWGYSSYWRLQNRVAILLILGLLGIQFAALVYDPVAQYPTSVDRKTGWDLIKRFHELSGSVWIFHHGYYEYLAGKVEFFDSVPLGDVVGGELPPVTSDAYNHRKQITDLWGQAIVQQIADWVVLDKLGQPWSPAYVMVEQFAYGPGAFYPVTGAAARPEYLLARNPIVRGGELPLGDALYNRLFDGWQPPQDKTRSVQGTQAQIEINIEPHSYQLKIQVAPVCQSGQLVATGLSVSWNKRQLGKLAFSGCQVQTALFEIPLDLVLKDPNQLSFSISSDNERDAIPFVTFYSIQFQPM